MTTRLHRRASFEVRRDAATVLSNGRVRYDALFSRWGMQDYPDGVEYRPEDEVFADASMATGELCPGVLLHPEQNYGTAFGPGSYPVRGSTGSVIVRDGIHTAGTLMVWDAEWNDLISSQEVAELSVGFTIEPDPTPGVAPEGAPGSDELGLDYVLVHRDIVWDHAAGVPEGNAGSARVITDSRSSNILPVTRRVLADIARGRADARTYYHDLGSMPRRETTDKDTKMDKQKLLLARLAGITRLDGKAFHDAWVDVYGESNDPDMQRALAALAVDESTPTPVAPPVAPVADAEEEEEPKPPPAESEEEEADAEDEESEEDADKEADDRADALEVARFLNGRTYTGRKDGKRLSTTQIKLDCITKTDPKQAEVVGRYDAKSFPIAVQLEFDRVRQAVADKATRENVDSLISAINRSRADTSKNTDAKLIAAAERMRKQDAAAASTSFGHTPATPAT